MAESVAAETRRRGRAHTHPVKFGWFVALAIVIHLPFTPLGALFGLVALLHRPRAEAPPDTLNAIPVSLLSPEEMAQLGGASAPPPGSPKTEESGPAPAEPPPGAVVRRPKPKPKPKPKPPTTTDGGAEVADAGESPRAAAKRVVSFQRDAGAPPLSAERRPTPDPLALVGRATTVADPNANVKLLLMNDRIRDLPLGPRIGRLIARLPQWQSFFGPTGLDPVRDIDRMYVAGPQFRSSGEVVAVLEYRISRSAMRRALDSIVDRAPKGKWFDSEVPAASAHADHADRIFVLPKGKLLLMVPPHLKEDAIAKAPGLKLPRLGGNAAVVAFVATPWRALSGLNVPVDVPKSIASVSVAVTPSDDGGALLHVEAVDASKEAARADADLLTRAINLGTQRDVGALGALLFGGEKLSLIEPIALRAMGNVIRGDARVTPRELERALAFAEGWVDAVMGPATLPVPERRP